VTADGRTVVHLLRHGEVDNPRGVLYGRLPGYHLSADGRAMAELAAKALADRDITLVVSSPLDRARETAEPVAAAHGLAISFDDRMIEAANVFEGLTFGVGDGSLGRPSHWRYLWNPLRPSWGEPYAELAARMLAAVTDARDAAAGHEAVLVSHQLPIWIVRRFVERRPLFHRPDRRQCGLASLTSITFDGERVVSVTYTEPAGSASRRPVTPGA
jgi:broad specificity phosphatase PhoE